MGVIIPNVPADSSVATDFGSNIAVLSPTIDAPTGGPDAYLLNRSDFPQKELPPVTGTRDARYQAVFRQSVLDDIHAHGKSSMEAEVCGVLIGDVYSDRMASWCYVEHSIRGNNAVGKQTQVTITSETWSRIHETLESQYPGKKIVGWYHTHPGFGIFLSGMDLFIQDNFFNQPWQIASVYDPHSGDEGTFIWRSGKSVREGILVENDTGVTPQESNAEAIERLAKKVKQLERRLDVILTGFLFLVLLALILPLVLFAMGPDTLRKLPLLHPKGSPSATTPAVPAPATQPAGNPDAQSDAAAKAGAGAAPSPASATTVPKLSAINEDAAGGSRTQTPKKAATH